MNRLRTNLLSDDQGRVTAFVVVITAACLMFAGLVLDGGLALGAKIRAISQAQEAARAGAQELDLTAYRNNGTLRLLPAQAHSAAQHYLAAVGATGTATVTGNTVSVTVTAHQHTQLLGLIGISDLTVSGTGSAQPHRDNGARP
jgi:Flp pilus assembly protein TadG